MLLELVANGRAPAAIVVREPEEILTLGGLVGQPALGCTVPVVQVGRAEFDLLGDFARARVRGGRIELFRDAPPFGPHDGMQAGRTDDDGSVRLAPTDVEMLSGRHGRAAQAAMRLLLRMTAVQGAEALADVTHVHFDGCI